MEVEVEEDGAAFGGAAGAVPVEAASGCELGRASASTSTSTSAFACVPGTAARDVSWEGKASSLVSSARTVAEGEVEAVAADG